MIKQGLLATAAMLAVSAPSFAAAQSVTVETVPPAATVTVPAPTGPAAPANTTYVLVPVAPQPAEVRPAPPEPGAQWIPGGWVWDSDLGNYNWVPSHYLDVDAPPADAQLDHPAAWVPGHYVTQADGLVWIQGHWQ
jgi:WXXGXW repeat (2 copies)